MIVWDTELSGAQMLLVGHRLYFEGVFKCRNHGVLARHGFSCSVRVYIFDNQITECRDPNVAADH